GGSPKPPPVRRAVVPDKAPPPKRAEGALPLKIKEPPKPPRQKPRPPTRTDDVSDDLLSADVSFERGTRPEAEAPRLAAPETEAPRLAAPEAEAPRLAAPEAEALRLVAPELEAPRLLAPDSSALAAPPLEPDASLEDPKPRAKASAHDESASAPPPRKTSRVIPAVLIALGGVGAFALAFRSQLPGDSAAEKPAAESPASAAALPPAPPDPMPPLPPPIEPPAADPTGPGAAPSPAPVATHPSGSTTAAPRNLAEPSPGSATATAPPSTASATPKPAITAPAPGTPEPSDAPRGKAEGPFNADAARTALAGAVAQASSCRKPGDPSGVAAVTITFSPSGRVTSATIAGPPFAGTPTGGCIAATLRRARVPAFEGDMVTVRKTVEIQ
ncbi:MAG TPA: hypothetical protein VFZ53_14475, partial [Polyangiaceae bacterium]